MDIEYRLAWLAGLFDGEGSFGIQIDLATDQRHIHARSSIQMSITSLAAIEEATDILTAIGIRGLGYTYQEKKPAKHLPSHHIRINRLFDMTVLCPRLIPYLVVKRKQATLLLEFAESRLVGVELDAKGRMRRGGTRAKPYTLQEIGLIEAIGELNKRGADDPRKAVRKTKIEMLRAYIGESDISA